MKVKQTLAHAGAWLKRVPLKYVFLSGFLVIVGVYAALYLPNKSVLFSYSGTTCVKHVLLFPGLYKRDGADYSAYATGEVKVGGFSLASTGLCFEPQKAPKPGVSTVAVAPFGGVFGKKNFAIGVPNSVSVNARVFDKPIPISKSLAIELSDTDKIFSYSLVMDGRETACNAEEKQLKCEVQTLGLDQGKPYNLELSRSFKSEEEKLTEKQVMTLSATKVTDSSVKGGETVYSKPKTVNFTFDKKITKVNASLVRVEGDSRTPLTAEAKVTDAGIEITAAEDLPRSADYEVKIDSVEAEDGSGLEDVYTLPFKMSGGPKVTGISVGKTGVPVGATAVITFDQAISEGQDIGKVVSLGGGATIAGKKENQILVSLAKVPKCGDFSIELNNDLQSKYDIGGNSAWKFGSRMLCHTVGTIGVSSKGRPINAYYFGNGPRTVLFTGAIHGNEVSTKLLMDRWIQDLEANARAIPADKSVVVVPQINPDGVASGSRTNARNIDLNRNFGTSDWRKDITDVNNRPFPGGGGENPMSEPEVNAIAGLASRLRPAVILSYHSIGGILAANQAGASNSLANQYSQLSGYRNTTGQTSDTFEYAVSGTADDWYAERLGVASILIELGSHTSPQFERNQKAMWAMVNS